MTEPRQHSSLPPSPETMTPVPVSLISTRLMSGRYGEPMVDDPLRWGVQGAGDDDLPPVLTIDQLAAFLQVSKDTAYRMCRSGEIKARKVSGQWRIHRAHLNDYLSYRPPDYAKLAESVKTWVRERLDREPKPEEVARLQLAMEQAGMIDPSEYRPGAWDDATQNAVEAIEDE